MGKAFLQNFWEAWGGERSFLFNPMIPDATENEESGERVSSGLGEEFSSGSWKVCEKIVTEMEMQRKMSL